LSLPTTEEAFFEKLQKWFPVSYDMKTMMRAAKGLKGGLQEVADDLGVKSPSLYPNVLRATHTCG
jgi:CCR4-NOT transcription complex subunit 7/8